MTKTIKCTNPSCESIITIEEGTMQVICPNCNTWHFPSSHDDQSGYPEPSGADPYAIPPVPGNQGPDSANLMPPPIPSVTPYEEPSMPVAEPVNPETPAVNQKPIGYLISEAGEQFILKEGKNIIGRQSGDLIINDRTVSRKHCIIEIMTSNSGGWEYTIYDIGHVEGAPSTNGVFVSGRSLRLQDYERIPIRNGTSIRIGNVRLVLQCN